MPFKNYRSTAIQKKLTKASKAFVIHLKSRRKYATLIVPGVNVKAYLMFFPHNRRHRE
jgi:hypothetical protein